MDPSNISVCETYKSGLTLQHIQILFQDKEVKDGITFNFHLFTFPTNHNVFHQNIYKSRIDIQRVLLDKGKYRKQISKLLHILKINGLSWD